MINLDKSVVLRQVFDTPGFSSSLTLAERELSAFRNLVEVHWLETIKKEYPELIADFSALGIARYHELSHLIDHDKLWHKSNRLLPPSSVDVIKLMPFMSTLREVFGHFDISDGVYDTTSLPDREEIYWRLVRPGSVGDVGPVHADKWFHEIQPLTVKGIVCNHRRSVKLWLPLFCEPGKSGLQMVADSHKKNWNYRVIDKDNKPRLEFLEDVPPVLISTLPGNFLLFNESTLHSGAVNQSDETRISVEITLVLSEPIAV